MVISLCSTNGGPHARPPTNYRWEFQTLTFVFLPDPFFIFLHHVFHISSLCRPDIGFVVPSSPIDLILTRDISISPLCFVTIGLLHSAHEALIQIFFNSVLKIGNLELPLSVWGANKAWKQNYTFWSCSIENPRQDIKET